MSVAGQVSSTLVRGTRQAGKSARISSKPSVPGLNFPEISPQAASQGRIIFAYKHFLTNQVVYSLSRTLHASVLKQLTFSGKQSLPNLLRRDHWAPYYTVHFPSALQGLRAFKKLREWRKLHEYSWTLGDRDAFFLKQRPRDEDREMIRQKKKELQGEKSWKFLARRGARRRMINTSKFVQDQKANSVADLAAVLCEQQERGEIWNVQGRPRQLEEIQDIIHMLEDRQIRLAKLKQLKETRIELLKWRGSPTTATSRGRKARQASHDDFIRKSKPVKANKKLQQKLMQLENVARLLLNRKLRDLPTRDPTAFAALQRTRRLAAITAPHDNEAASEEAEKLRAQDQGEVESVIRENDTYRSEDEVEIIPENETHSSGDEPQRPFNIRPRDHPELEITASWREVVNMMEPELLSFFGRKSYEATMQGVRIEWADAFDKEHAEKWPEEVEHQAMGFLKRNSVRRADDPTKFELRDEYAYDAQGNMIIAHGWQTRLGLRLRLGTEEAKRVIALGKSVPGDEGIIDETRDAEDEKKQLLVEDGDDEEEYE